MQRVPCETIYKNIELEILQPCQDPQRPKPIFQKEDEYREPLLVWVRPSQVWHTHRHNFLQTTSTNDTISINDIFQKGCNFLANNHSLGMSSVDSPEAHRAWYQPCLQVKKRANVTQKDKKNNILNFWTRQCVSFC